MSSIFMCHSSRDKDFVRILKTRLGRYNIRVWVDEDEIKAGESLISSITDAISEMEYLGIVLSPNAVQSKWVKEELQLALNQQIEKAKIKVIPILLRQCKIPSFLKGKKYISFKNWKNRKGDSLSAPVIELVKSLDVDPTDSERWSGRKVTTIRVLKKKIEEYFSPLQTKLVIFEDESGIDKIVVDNGDDTLQIYSYWSYRSYIQLIDKLYRVDGEKPIVDVQFIEEILWEGTKRNDFIKAECKKQGVNEREFWEGYGEGLKERDSLSKKIQTVCFAYDNWLLDETAISLVHEDDFGTNKL